MLEQGIYEQVIYKALKNKLAACDSNEQGLRTEKIDDGEASKILAAYLSKVVEKALNIVKENDGNVQKQIALTNKIIETIANASAEPEQEDMSVDERAEQLMAVINRRNTIYALNPNLEVKRPQTSIAASSLFTGAPKEPTMASEISKEIASCDRIDMLVSFIRWSGLRQILEELTEFTQNGGQLRIITTTYMGATEAKAIEELQKLPNTEIKISYNTKSTRLHAKSYVFYRKTGFTTAYVGSSNLSRAAISTGLEWNVKITNKDLPDTITKIMATFDAYWNMPEFEEYCGTATDKIKLQQGLKNENYSIADPLAEYHFDVNPYNFQQDILDKLTSEREVHNRYRNLVVAATGTGKTVISAFDYKRFCMAHPGQKNRLLFIAHREEILRQSMYTFRGILKDSNFGELFTGNNVPAQTDHLFMTIQTFTSKEWEKRNDPDFYDFIIVDECHHADADSYQSLFGTYKPKILLGLTATPERMDGGNILKYFNDTIAAEIRLPEAIERDLLCSFQYFGVSDEVDLSGLKWSQGGYSDSDLNKVYVLEVANAIKRAQLVLRSINKYVNSIAELKGLGFCVSVEHAEFMAKWFNSWGVSSMALHGNSTVAERIAAKAKLQRGEIKFIFTVNLYNEGVDIPEINTVLFLRPTKSLTIFLQQLGRGLRKCEGKECLTVLDFIGQAHAKYRFSEKYAALLTHTHNSIKKEVEDGFTSVPKGCYIKLEKLAKRYILDNVKASFSRSAALVDNIRDFTSISGLPLTLTNFVQYYKLDTRLIYKFNNFSRLCVLAERLPDFTEPQEQSINSVLKRACTINSRRWLKLLLELLPNVEAVKVKELTEVEARMLQMFLFTLDPNTSAKDCTVENTIRKVIDIKQSCPVLFAELLELLQYNLSSIDFVDEQVSLGYTCPLDLHCQYSRDQIFVGLGYFKPSVIRQGVKWLAECKADVLINTLNKTLKNYSPTTMYQDYSISDTLFHWQSQSTTSETSPTGRRYIHHKQMGSKVLLFVREYENDNYGNTNPFTFLGLCDYASHTGSKPMSIIWKLEKPIPANFIKVTNKLVVE